MITINSTGDFLTALNELERRSKHQLNTHVPTNVEGHNQLSFHSSEADIRLLFGGNQSGKSLSAAVEIAWWARGKHPYRFTPSGKNLEIWVISPEYLLIEKGIYRHLKTLIPDWDVVKVGPTIPGRQLPSFIVVRNGEFNTTIQFLSAKGDNHDRFQAAAVDLISIDEEIPGGIWEELQARTLVSGGQFIISATLVESNEWITHLEERAVKGDVKVHLTRLNTEKNPYVNQAVLQQLMKTWSKETIEYRIKGNSRRLSGIIFSNWDKEFHEIKPFTIPKEWPRWFALDPGWRTCAGLWIAVDPDDVKYLYRELYAHNEPLYNIATAIKEAEGYELDIDLTKTLGHYVWRPKQNFALQDSVYVEDMVNRVIDDQRESHTVTGEFGVLTQMSEKYGINFVPAQKQVVAGIETIRSWLEHKKFKCFDTCVNFLEERRIYRIKETTGGRHKADSPDKPIKRKDHAMDAWRFLANEEPRYADRNLRPIHTGLTGQYSGQSESPSEFINRIVKNDKHPSAHEYLGSNW